ncbi:hypothetical protein BJ165DRAFT_1533011 [Panaeolus papilionaceus]|nr:hypothetical protein BJ165DRAFT_1533011 [Panaeolus papilionaceus]
MIPRLARFANPHLVPQKEVKITRKEIYREDGDDDELNVSPDAEELEALKNLVECGLLVPDITLKTKKRRKLDDGKAEDETHLFRLVSSRRSPQPISLLPPPPPEPITREPDAEDSEEQAELRRVHAQSAAVTLQDIQFSASIEKSRPFAKQSISATASVSISTPLAVLCTAQQPRKTRPPVPAESLQKYPYTGQPSSPSKDKPLKLPQDCPLVDVVPIEMSTRKPRRRNRSAKNKERPPPQFWRPDPSWGGKSLGYAYGYPSGLAVTQGFGRSDHWRYQRDTMAKIVN